MLVFTVISLFLYEENGNSECNFEEKLMQVSFLLEFCVHFGNGVVRSYKSSPSCWRPVVIFFISSLCVCVCVNQ